MADIVVVLEIHVMIVHHEINDETTIEQDTETTDCISQLQTTGNPRICCVAKRLLTWQILL
jgi:hypothetical protein